MIETWLGTQQLVQGREKSFCSVGNWAAAPAPTLLPGRAILLPVSDVDRLLPGAAGLPQAPNRAAFIKRLSASERARGRGVWGERAESQPGRGAAGSRPSLPPSSLGEETPQSLGSRWSEARAGTLCQEWDWPEAAGQPPVLFHGPAKLCPTCLAAPSPPLFSQTKDNYGKETALSPAGKLNTSANPPTYCCSADWLGSD